MQPLPTISVTMSGKLIVINSKSSESNQGKWRPQVYDIICIILKR